MHCPRQITYAIEKGDNLYQLAKYYHTTVAAIISMNPNIDPYNLQIGAKIALCPGKSFLMRVTERELPDFSNFAAQTELTNEMRLVWEQHIYWTRMLLISIAGILKDQGPVTDRLLQNPYDIADIFAKYYSQETAKTIARLLIDHLQIGAEIITALRDGRKVEADQLTRQWYINADKMTEAFNGINPYYEFEPLHKMLYSHLELTVQEVAMRIAENYKADIEAFSRVEQEAISMADYFTAGIIEQFPQKFEKINIEK